MRSAVGPALRAARVRPGAYPAIRSNLLPSMSAKVVQRAFACLQVAEPLSAQA